MSNNSSGQAGLILFVIVLIVCGIAVKDCADLFHLPWKIMLQEIVATVIVDGAAIASWLFGADWRAFRLSVAWPALLGLLFVAWWPALDAWNTISAFPSPLDYGQTDSVTMGNAIWDTAWFRWGIVALCGAGYGWRYSRESYY